MKPKKRVMEVSSSSRSSLRMATAAWSVCVGGGGGGEVGWGRTGSHLLRPQGLATAAAPARQGSRRWCDAVAGMRHVWCGWHRVTQAPPV